MSKIWRSVDLSWINCEIELDLSWSNKCIVSEISITFAKADDRPTATKQTTGETFQINNANLYVSVVAVSINDNITFLENIKQGFNRTKNNNSTSNNNNNNNNNNNSFDRYYISLVEIKDFNVLIDILIKKTIEKRM